MERYGVALGVADGRLGSIEVGGQMIEDDREDEEVVVAWPGPGSPVREVPVEEQQHSQQTLDVEGGAVDFPLFGEQVLGGLCEEGGDLVLVEPVEKFAL